MLRPIHTSTTLPTKRLTTNLPNVKLAFTLFTRQRQLTETLMKAGVVVSSPPITVCVVFCANPYINVTYGYINNSRWLYTTTSMIIIFCHE